MQDHLRLLQRPPKCVLHLLLSASIHAQSLLHVCRRVGWGLSGAPAVALAFRLLPPSETAARRSCGAYCRAMKSFWYVLFSVHRSPGILTFAGVLAQSPVTHLCQSYVSSVFFSCTLDPMIRWFQILTTSDTPCHSLCDGPQPVAERCGPALVQLANSRRCPNSQGPCCHDALSAKLIEQAGFPYAFMSGFCTSAAQLGAPDTGLISYGEMVDTVSWMPYVYNQILFFN